MGSVALSPPEGPRSPDSGVAVFSRRNGIDLDVVYCLSNESMPGRFKIGFTTRTATARANELYVGYGDEYTTGVPVPFDIVREWELPSGRGEHVEKAVHRVLNHRRPNPKREFFLFDDAQHAVSEIERALHELDWYVAAVAEASEKRREAELRAIRFQAAAEAKSLKEAQAREIASRVEREIRSAAESRFHEAGLQHALGRAAVAGVGLGLVGLALGAKDGFYIFALIFSAVTFWWTRSAPLDTFLTSDEYKESIRAAIDRAMPATQLASVQAAGAQSTADPRAVGDAIGSSAAELDCFERRADQSASRAQRPNGATTGPPYGSVRATAVPAAPPLTAVRPSLVSARCPSCECLHSVSVSRGSYVRVHCERCGVVFETEVKASNKVPDMVASRAYLVSFKPSSRTTGEQFMDDRATISEGLVTARYVQPSVGPKVTSPARLARSVPPQESVLIKPDSPKVATLFAADIETAISKPAVAQCTNCGRLHTVNAHPGDFVDVVCEGCGQHFHETAVALTLGGGAMH